MKRVAERAKAIMAAQGLNQGQVAYKSGIPPGVLSGLLKGTKDQAAFATVFKLARGLGVSLDQLADLTPLPIPEAAPPEADLRQQLADAKTQFAEMLQKLADRVDGLADQLESQQSSGTPPQKSGGRRRTA